MAVKEDAVGNSICKKGKWDYIDFKFIEENTRERIMIDNYRKMEKIPSNYTIPRKNAIKIMRNMFKSIEGAVKNLDPPREGSSLIIKHSSIQQEPRIVIDQIMNFLNLTQEWNNVSTQVLKNETIREQKSVIPSSNFREIKGKMVQQNNHSKNIDTGTGGFIHSNTSSNRYNYAMGEQTIQEIEIMMQTQTYIARLFLNNNYSRRDISNYSAVA